jgi:hypothetical protein
MLLALSSAAFAGQAQAAAGRIDFISGGVTVAGRDGRERPLARGAELDSGDTVKTANDGRAQIRFTDGSYVSLQPNSDFAISEYKYDGKTDGSERGFYGLVKGAMRTVTGAIGRVNRNAYRVSTPTATVGIRGTGGVIQVLNDGSTLVIGTSGIWSLTNPAGSIDVPAGISGLAPSEPNTPPRESSTQPQTSTTAPILPEDQGYVQGDQVNPDGTAAIQPAAPTMLVSGGGYQVAAFWSPNSSSATSFSNGGIDAIFDGSGRMTEFKNAAGAMWKSDASGTHADFGTDGILAWGRWTGNVTANGTPQSYSANQGLHYVIGMPTPTMPTTGTATYSLIGATRPTDVSGVMAPGTFTGSLNVTFGATHTIGVSYTVAIGGGTYVVNHTGTGTGSSFSQTGTGNFASGAFAGSSGSVCTGSCSSFVQGFFAGASAERAGIGYHISDTIVGKNIIGTAAFTKN